jgi:hypothetical protein
VPALDDAALIALFSGESWEARQSAWSSVPLSDSRSAAKSAFIR